MRSRQKDRKEVFEEFAWVLGMGKERIKIGGLAVLPQPPHITDA